MEQFCQDKTIAIVGGGPAGIYCALNILHFLKEKNIQNYKLDIIDKSQILRTILPTGGGRCNITNAIYDMDEFLSNYPRGQKFLRPIFSKYLNYDSIDFFKSIGIETYAQDDNRVFPKSNSSKDVKDKMLSALKKYKNVKFVNKRITSKDELSSYDYIIVATGSRDSVDLLNSLDQPYKPFKSALASLIVENFNYPQGVSVKSLDGEFVFTDSGISGPLAYKISSINLDSLFPYNVKIRLFNVNDLICLINKFSKKSIGNLVSQLIPKSLAAVLVRDYDKKAAEVSKKDLISYSELNLKVVSHSNGYEIVNAGGVDLNFVDKNCKSKINQNLWFCGEILDIDGFCGGFNLQNCWSSAFIVAKNVVQSIKNDTIGE